MVVHTPRCMGQRTPENEPATGAGVPGQESPAWQKACTFFQLFVPLAKQASGRRGWGLGVTGM